MVEKISTQKTPKQSTQKKMWKSPRTVKSLQSIRWYTNASKKSILKAKKYSSVPPVEEHLSLQANWQVM